MVFSDLFFLFAFLPAFALLYVGAGYADRAIGPDAEGYTHRLRNVALTIFSLIFYAWGEPVYILLMLVCVLLNYIAGIGIDRGGARRKAWLVAGITANLAILCTFKYLGFLAGILHLPDPGIALPIGISFYVFQSISYLVDVYRGTAAAQQSYWGLLLYISMFPQLIAGPIVRYGNVAGEIKSRRVSPEDLSEGIFRFLLGLGKKVILANQLSEVSDRFLGGDLNECTMAGAWIGVIAFTLQIYFDFSGYSDMAIGIGRCLGFHFNENFNLPYTSKSITEFWRRWHMSLGTFFRDYVYIPMGGNRRRQILNIMVVWFLTGMWHGASWNFIIWGLYFGIILLVEKHTLLRIQGRVPAPLLHFYAMLIVTVGFGIFYFDDFGRLGQWFAALTGQSGELCGFAEENILFEKFWLFIAAIAFCMPVRSFIGRMSTRVLEPGGSAHRVASLSWRMVVAVALLIVSVALLIGATNNAFLYTRF